MKERFIDCGRAIVANDQTAKVSEPGKGALHFPTAPIAAQRSTVLGARLAAIPPARPIRSRVPPIARAMDRYRRRDQQSHAGVSDVAAHRDVAGSHESTRAFLPRAGLRWAMQSKVAFPEEHPGRRPPPSTSCPCPAWFFQLSSPFFGRSETAVQKRFAPVELLALVQFRQKCAPNGEPDLLLFPIPQSPPAGRR